MTKFVYDFSEGDRSQKDLLGGKGANLCEMTNLGLPVPPGFVITTEACRAYLARVGEGARAGDAMPDGLEQEISEHLATLEKAMGKRLGDADDPLDEVPAGGEQAHDLERLLHRVARLSGLAAVEPAPRRPHQCFDSRPVRRGGRRRR